MSARDPLTALHALQRPDGLFRATIAFRDGRRIDDANAFVTAVVLRRLRHARPAPLLAAIIDRALDGLQSCASPDLPGAYGFWPAGERPAWARAVPADIDDTALILTECYRYQRLGRAAVLRSIAAAILPMRVVPAPDGTLPPWIVKGSFLTWIAPGRRSPNISDCCVNANVAGLLAMVGATHLPGYDEAVRTVLAGLAWAAGEPLRLGAITPFYPSPHALLDAVEHAAECGAYALLPAVDRLRALPPATLDAGEGLCRDAYGHTVWHCEAAAMAAAQPSPRAA